ncbi:MAG: tyrosine-type recombinase/integrase [Gammaproteobacteria bacterium]
MTSIYPVGQKNGTTVWVHRYRVPTGDPKKPYKMKSKTYYSERDAEQARASQPTIAKCAKRMKLGEFVSAFWLKRSKEQHGSSTQSTESSRLKNYLLPYFGQRYLDRITQSDVATYLNNLEGKRGDKGELSGRSKQNLFGLLHSILQYAVELGQLEKNPIARALGSRRNIVRPTADRTEKPILSAEDIWAIIGKVEERFIPLIHCFARTGLRASEVFGFKWKDYDAERRTLSVHRAIVNGKEGKTKSKGSEQVKGVDGVLAAELEKQQQHVLWLLRRFPTPEDYIFPTRTGKAHRQDDICRRVLYPAMDKAGIKRGKRTHGWHIFRHTAITKVLEETGDIHRASRFAGHASVAFTQQVYIHADPQAVDNAKRLEKWLDGKKCSLNVPSETTQRGKSVQ